MADSLQQVTQRIQAFLQEREWTDLQPADLAKSIVLEAAELLEHYQWDATATHRKTEVEQKEKEELAAEAADVCIYLIQFCLANNIDLLHATNKKLDHNAKKYDANNMKEGGMDAYHATKAAHRAA